MFNPKLTPAAIAMALLATPAMANETARPPVADNSQICLQEAATGSRIASQSCRTLSEWQARMEPRDFASLLEKLEARRANRIANTPSTPRQ
jgi:hypothetical protein